MIKLGIIGSEKQIQIISDVVERTGKFIVAGSFSPSAKTWEDAFFNTDYEDFINKTDSLFFCDGIEWYSPLVEKAIYNFKHIFSDGLKVENCKRLKEWENLVHEAGIVFHAGNQFSVSPSFLSVWQYLKKCNWLELNIRLPFKDREHFRSVLSQTLELAIKSVRGSIEKFNKNESSLFGFDFPEHFSLWMDSSGGTNCKINISYSRSEKELKGVFGTSDKLFEVDFIEQKVWELQKSTDNIASISLFNSENELELQQLLPEIKRVQRQVIYFDSLSKELLNFWDNITNHLSPLTGINELVEVSVLCEKVFPETDKCQAC
ncbi:MAG: hypothetical protein J5I91_03575 [Bacteroidetes bacterium]|nr:hypothetical protein [Bacteroidota bacterium]